MRIGDLFNIRSLSMPQIGSVAEWSRFPASNLIIGAELKLKIAINPELERRVWSWGEAVEVVSPVTLRGRIRVGHQRAAIRNRSRNRRRRPALP
jgi:hypothetical protein